MRRRRPEAVITNPLLRLKQRLDQETSFMLLEAGERDTSVDAIRNH